MLLLYFLIISLILAMVSAILSLIAPNKLSSLTDTITLGTFMAFNIFFVFVFVFIYAF